MSEPNRFKAVATLTAPVLQVRTVEAGETVGYSHTWQAERQSRIAIVAVGYADGMPWDLSWPGRGGTGPAQVMVAGTRAPIVGRVSMDMITIDVTECPEGAVHRGTQVELLGDEITVNDWAQRAGTIPYEILTSLGRRYARVYVS
jgi:alanine racemase